MSRPFEKGDTVVIVNQYHGHGFEIGEAVVLVERDETGEFDWYASSGSADWFVKEDEIEHA